MKRVTGIALIIMLIFVTGLYAKGSETYLKFEINADMDLQKLSRLISIDNVNGLTVFAYANETQLENFRQMGYEYTILPHPGKLIQPAMSADKAVLRDWDVYPTYDAYVSMMYQFEIDYPGLCEIVNAGSTVQGRDILFARITDNIGIEEDEPEVMYTSSMHGDETTGYVMMLRLIDSILVSYGTDLLITRLVDNCEIWINPLANPDGSYAGGNSSIYGATRSNANWVDLNRNFADPDDGPHPDGNSWQPETVVMMDFAESHSFVISANFHGGIEVVNYPWDTWSRFHVDDAWMIDISRQFADSAQYYSPGGYMTALDNGITNGYAWYTITGGRQDYMNFFRGCREITMEVSDTKLLSASQLPAHWVYLRSSLFHYLEQGLYGIRGIVTDENTGDPVFATITVSGHDIDIDSSRVFTDPDVGDYHRMIESGIYDIYVSAPGYYTKQVKSIMVFDFATSRKDVVLTPLPNEPVMQFVSHNAGPVNPGDDVSLNIMLENIGAGNANNLDGTLSSDDPYITLTQGYSTYPVITALGGTGTSVSAYQFSVGSSCPLYHNAEFSLIMTADGDYIDTTNFSISVGEIIENFESADFSSMDWQMSGTTGWVISTTDPYEGAYSAKSGNISHNQYSSMSLTLDIASAGEISFYFSVSSESGYDYLEFYIDGVKKSAWAGIESWQQVSYAVGSGSHTFRWTYDKDGSVSDYSDCGWVDQILFPPINLPAPIINTTSIPDWTMGVGFSQQLLATGGTGQLTWSDKNSDLIGSGFSLSATGLLSGTPVIEGLIEFTARVEDQLSSSDEQFLSFTINPALSIVTVSLPDGMMETPYSQQLTASGGTGGLTWNDKNNDLNGSGLTLSTSGLLSGTVTDPANLIFTAQVTDAIGGSDEPEMSVNFDRSYVCGDANGDLSVDLGDTSFIINYIFYEGPAPSPLEAGDANWDGTANLADASYIINYIFRDGGTPNCGE